MQYTGKQLKQKQVQTINNYIDSKNHGFNSHTRLSPSQVPVETLIFSFQVLSCNRTVRNFIIFIVFALLHCRYLWFHSMNRISARVAYIKSFSIMRAQFDSMFFVCLFY